MARRTAEGDKAEEKEALVLGTATADQKADAAVIGIPGGAPGIIEEARAKITFPGEATPGKKNPDQAPGRAVVQQFTIKGPGNTKEGTWRLLYGGCVIHMAPGRLISSAAYDVDYIKSQGVKMEEVLPPPPPVDSSESATA